MRRREYIAAALAVTLSALPTAPRAAAEQTLYVVCSARVGHGPLYGVTEVSRITTRKQMPAAEATKQFDAWLKSSNSALIGYCSAHYSEAEARDARAADLRRRSGTVVEFGALFDASGNIPTQGGARPGPTDALRQEVSRPSPQATPTAPRVSEKPPARAVDVAPPVPAKSAGQVEVESRIEEHRRLMAASEQAIAASGGAYDAGRLAADADLARFRARFTEQDVEREAQASGVRAEWTMRAAGLGAEAGDDARIEFKEGVVLCQELDPASKAWSCHGPLQNIAVIFDAPVTNLMLGQACGSDRSIRDLGMVSGYRAFGCGFGIHPTARDYPGNTDVPARLGVGVVPGRGAFFCPGKKLTYCRG